MLICQECLGKLFKRPKNSSLIAVCQNCGRIEVPCIEMAAFHAKEEVLAVSGLPNPQVNRDSGYLFLDDPHPSFRK